MKVRLVFKFREGEDVINHRPMICHIGSPVFEEHNRFEKEGALMWVQEECRRRGLTEKELISQRKETFLFDDH